MSADYLNHNNHRAWHWPNRTVGKEESGSLRQEHNRLYNDYHKALRLLQQALTAMEAQLENDDPQARTQMEWEQEPLASIRAMLNGYETEGDSDA